MAILIMDIQIPMSGFMTNCFHGKVTHVLTMAHQTQKSRDIKQTPKQNRKTQRRRKAEKRKQTSREAKKQQKAEKQKHKKSEKKNRE
jgi:hypothetical protein